MIENENKKAYAVASLVAFIVDFVITGYATMYIWNNVCATYLGLQKITFWIGYLISLAITYFFHFNISKREKLSAKDTFERFLNDIIYTLVSWGIVALLVNFVV